MKNLFKKCLNAVACLTPYSIALGEVVAAADLPLSQYRPFLCRVCASLSLDIFALLGCYIPQIASTLQTHLRTIWRSHLQGTAWLLQMGWRSPESSVNANQCCITSKKSETHWHRGGSQKWRIFCHLSYPRNSSMKSKTCVIKTNQMHFSIYASISRCTVQKMWKKSKTLILCFRAS